LGHPGGEPSGGEKMRFKSVVAIMMIVAAGLASAVGGRAQNQGAFNERLLEAFTYRNLGPFRMQVRIADLAVPDAPAKDHLYTMYVAPWIGGLFKTTNNGTTFEPVFDTQDNLSIGDVTVAPSNSEIVWVGSGDAYTSRTSYAGNGVYKSTDAGKTWKNMGLRDTQHIARIVIHPTNPNVVWVAAMGHLYSTNQERGVFKTTNGGETWEKIFYINEKVGVIDLILHPGNPDILYAAAYEKDRMPWQIINGGPGSGIHKSLDGGRTWKRLEGGLPTGKIGRIGLDIYLKNPEILYAVIENSNTRDVSAAATAAPGARGAGQGAGAPGRVTTIGGEVYRTENGGQTWKKMNSDDYNVSPKGPYYFSQIRVDPSNDLNIFVTQDGFRRSIDGGKTWNAPMVFPRMFGDFRTLWFDPQNPLRMISGGDGGIATSYDGGKTSDAYSNMPLGSVYALGVDMEDPYNVYAGLQDHEHWRGPSNGPSGKTSEQDWFALGNGDGIYTQVDPTDSRWLYTTRQYGGHTRLDQKLGYTTNIQPQRAPGLPPHRFLWEPPIHISPHQSNVIYAGSQVLLKSVDRGDHWTEISPDLSSNDTSKIFPESEGGVPGGIPWFAISTIMESPITQGLIWVGTSDGKVQLTRDGGANWTDLSPKINALGGRGDAYVSRVHSSFHVAGRAYVSRSGYKFDDFRPFLYRTDDFGATWTSIVGNLPNQPINVIYEDRKNPNLLFVGNDTGVYVSINRGTSWVKMNNNIPNVPVKDLIVHPRENDLVVGTYGRGLFITNIGPLQEMSEATLAEDIRLFEIKPTVQRITWSFGANDYLFGQRNFQTPNEPNGMVIRYYLKNPGSSGASVSITDAKGQEVARLQGRAAAGINTVLWTMRAPGMGRGRGAGGNVLEGWAPLGEYTITLELDGKKFTQKGRITKMQGWSIGGTPQIIK
jgi:photosystem II stability/assembly factor-like uncharacterized protein